MNTWIGICNLAKWKLIENLRAGGSGSIITHWRSSPCLSGNGSRPKAGDEIIILVCKVNNPLKAQSIAAIGTITSDEDLKDRSPADDKYNISMPRRCLRVDVNIRRLSSQVPLANVLYSGGDINGKTIARLGYRSSMDRRQLVALIERHELGAIAP